MENLNEFRMLIEEHPVALATVTGGSKPNVIAVACAKVVSGNQVLITDNYMSQTLKDLAADNSVCLLVWDADMRGCKLIGNAEYHTEGKWKKMVEGMEENCGLPAKGALLINISRIIPSR